MGEYMATKGTGPRMFYGWISLNKTNDIYFIYIVPRH